MSVVVPKHGSRRPHVSEGVCAVAFDIGVNVGAVDQNHVEGTAKRLPIILSRVGPQLFDFGGLRFTSNWRAHTIRSIWIVRTNFLRRLRQINRMKLCLPGEDLPQDLEQ